MTIAVSAVMTLWH